MADNEKKNLGNTSAGGSGQNVSHRLEARKRKKRMRIIRWSLLAVAAVAVGILIFFGVRAWKKQAGAAAEAGKESSAVSAASAGESLLPGTVSASSEEALSPTPTPDPTLTPTPTPAPLVAETIEIEERTPADLKMSFTGDFILGTDENFAYETGFPYYYDTYGPDYFMQNVKEIFETDDLTVINFEGTLTNETTREYKQFAFKGDPEYIDIINKASIEAANLANNHSADYGEQSYLDTLNILEENNIAHFGYDDVAVLDVKGFRVGIFGIYELESLGWVAPEVTACMDKLKSQECDLIIAVFHWGTELQAVPDGYQVQLAHQAIDEGADLVIGHHPHVLQGIEYYKGKTICYSLGNFCFGGNSHPTEMDTIIFQQTFHMDSKGRLTGTDINVIPCCVSRTWEYNDYVPTVMTGEDAKTILEKLDYRSELISWNYECEGFYSSETDGTTGFTFSSPKKEETEEAGSGTEEAKAASSSENGTETGQDAEAPASSENESGAEAGTSQAGTEQGGDSGETGDETGSGTGTDAETGTEAASGTEEETGA